MPVEIRPAQRSDAAAISAFLEPLADKFIAREFDPSARSKFLATFSAAAVDGYLGSGFRYHLACCQGSIVGVVSTRNESHVYHLFVDESVQRTGLGRRLWLGGSAATAGAAWPAGLLASQQRFWPSPARSARALRGPQKAPRR